jgi:putative ABC transport system permease protein
MSWLRRVLNTVRSSRTQDEIERELSFHIVERVDDLRARGLSEEEALRRARQQFGNTLVQRERTRDVDVSLSMDALLRNIRHACRALVRTPGFTLAVVMTLALGMGANTAVFSMIDAVLLRSLPFPDADRLVQLTEITETSGEITTAAVRLYDWDRLATTFAAITNYVTEHVSDTTGVEPEVARRATVGARFLDVVGIRPSLGRGFTAREHRMGGGDVVLISDRYWNRRFGRDPNVLTRTVRMVDRTYAIVGVMPATFGFPSDDIDWWVPQFADAPWTQNRQFKGFFGVGRLAPGVNLDQARSDLARVQAQLATQYPRTDSQLRPQVTPLKDALVGGMRASLWLLFGSVSVLLLIACVNIAALLLARGAQRWHEVAVRYALGASRRSVALQLLTESAVLALAGAAAGIAVAVAISSAFRTLAPTLPRLADITIDGRVLIYTLAATVAVAILCGLVPAFRSSRTPALRTGIGRAQVSVRQPLQWLLVGVQVALSVTLLATAALLVRSLDALSRVDTGFEPANVLTFRVSGAFGEEREYVRIVQRINRTLDELAQQPGIEATATTLSLPGLPGGVAEQFRLVELRDSSTPISAQSRAVSPSYFDVLRIPILEGELCSRPTDESSTSEVMVNRAFASRYVRGRSAVGLHIATATPNRIAGIVGDAREIGIDREPVPTLYNCISAATPIPLYLARTQGDPRAAIERIRATLRRLEPLRSVYDFVPLEREIDNAYAQNRLRTVVLVSFALTALSLACLGVYGTLSYAVSLRRREIGLRIALGSSRMGIVKQFLVLGLRVVCGAVAVGLVMSLAFARGLSGMLFGISPTDPATLGGVTLLVLVVGAVALFVPAARATIRSPAHVLRQE